MLVANSIALVDDDKNILTSVAIALEAEGFQVRSYSDGAEALRGLAAQPVDLAILDIKKPFSQRLLVERIRALLRRGELARGSGESEPVVQRGELLLDPARHQC